MVARWRAIQATIVVLLLLGIFGWLMATSGNIVELGCKKGTNPAIPTGVQQRLFEYLKESSSVKISSLSSNTPLTKITNEITDRNELQELLAHLKFCPIEDQGDRGEDSVYWIMFSLPNGNEAVVHVTRHGWKFTGGGPRREYSERLLDFLGSRNKAIRRGATDEKG